MTATASDRTAGDSDPAPGGPSVDHPGSARPVNGIEGLLTLLGGVWLVLGLFIDGYAHSEIIDTETEDFFTPWHAIFYSGFLFTVAVLGWILRRRADRPGPVNWIPPGYGWAVVGAGVFAIGGVGDGIWHTIFGVETSIDALLSPTHLVLLLGLLLILSTPLRAFWVDPTARASWSSAGMAVASVTLVTALMAFFITYAFSLRSTWYFEQVYVPETGTNEGLVARSIAGAFLVTILLVVPVLGLVRRTDLPTGALAVMWTVPVLLHNLAFDGDIEGVVAALVGATAAEVALRRLDRGPASAPDALVRRRRAILVGIPIGVAGLWSTWMGLIAIGPGLGWMPELWAGHIVSCALVSGAMGLVAFPPPTPVDGPLRRSPSVTGG